MEGDHFDLDSHQDLTLSLPLLLPIGPNLTLSPKTSFCHLCCIGLRLGLHIWTSAEANFLKLRRKQKLREKVTSKGRNVMHLNWYLFVFVFKCCTPGLKHLIYWFLFDTKMLPHRCHHFQMYVPCIKRKCFTFITSCSFKNKSLTGYACYVQQSSKVRGLHMLNSSTSSNPFKSALKFNLV